VIQREVVIPVEPDILWRALTDPEEVSGWFGAEVEWELRPGGGARWRNDADDERRHGVVEEVSEGRALRFVWWPEQDDGSASEVTYQLEPTDAGTRLVVTEMVTGRRYEPADHGAQARASSAWSPWDSRVAGLWVRAHGRSDARVAVRA
jgi:uncharacterized protein YndB with AHSA1/START domain